MSPREGGPVVTAFLLYRRAKALTFDRLADLPGAELRCPMAAKPAMAMSSILRPTSAPATPSATGAWCHSRPGAVRLGAVALAAVLLASACTGSFEDFERAVELAMDKGTVRMESETHLRRIPRGGGEQEELRILVEASIDLPSDRGDLTFTMEFLPAPEEPGPLPCRMIVEEDTTYLAVPAGGWLRTDLFPLEDEDDPLATDPRATFEFLKAVFGDVSGVGFEEVRGVQTRHWKVFVDVDRLLEEEGEAPQRGFLSRLTRNKLPMDVWIDSDGLLRRIAYSLREPVPGGSVEMSSTTDIFDYGEPLSIEIPPASEVQDEPNPARALFACLGAPV